MVTMSYGSVVWIPVFIASCCRFSSYVDNLYSRFAYSLSISQSEAGNPILYMLFLATWAISPALK